MAAPRLLKASLLRQRSALPTHKIGLPTTKRRPMNRINSKSCLPIFALASLLHPPRLAAPALPLSDAVFNIVFKVYSTVSQRRFMSDLREAHNRGFISKVPHFNSISNYLENPELDSNTPKADYREQLCLSSPLKPTSPWIRLVLRTCHFTPLVRPQVRCRQTAT